MRRTQLDAEARDAFLVERRLSILIFRSEDGAPLGRPLWYAWDGREVEMFSERGGVPLRALERDARATVLVTHIPPESVCWVSLEGRVLIDPAGGQAAAARLATRYLLDYRDAAAARKRLAGIDLVRLRLVPERICSFAELP